MCVEMLCFRTLYQSITLWTVIVIKKKFQKSLFPFDFFHFFLTECEGVELGLLEEVGSSDCHCVQTLLIIIRIQHEI